MNRRTTACLLAAVSVLAPFATWPAHADVRSAALSWLESRQRPSGAFGADDAPADQVAEALAAVAVAGGSADVRDRALGYLRAHGPARAREQATYAARIVIGLVAAGEDPRDFDGVDYVGLIRSRYTPVLATHGGNLYADLTAGIGRTVGGDSLPQAFLDRLEAAQCANGGWSWQDRCGAAPDVDTTSVAISLFALAGRKPGAAPLAEALDWLASTQLSMGAFPTLPNQAPNANSTGLVVTALVTAGIEPRGFGRADPVRGLESFATEDGGLAYLEGGQPNLYATIQGLPGLALAGHPFGPVPEASPSPEPTYHLPTADPVPSVAVPSISAVPTAVPSLPSIEAVDRVVDVVAAPSSEPPRRSPRAGAAAAAGFAGLAGVATWRLRRRLTS